MSDKKFVHKNEKENIFSNEYKTKKKENNGKIRKIRK